MEEAAKLLQHFKIGFEMHVASAHRSPDRVATLCPGGRRARPARPHRRGRAAAAHLAGVVAAHTILPVVGVPMDGGTLHGLDALLSTVQMPGGIPVATVAIGKAGARNAALLAVQILALTDARLRRAPPRLPGGPDRPGGSPRTGNCRPSYSPLSHPVTRERA